MIKKWKLAVGGLAAFFLSIALGAGAYYLAHPYFFKSAVNNEVPEQEQEEEVVEDPAEDAPGYYFAGWKDKARGRALAVVIDNVKAARPQTGLEDADVVVEVPVEGGITRFLALICCDNLDLVGPVRSARSYFVDLAEAYKAIWVHAGGSPDSLQQLAARKLEHLDEITGGGQVAGAFWRAPDRSKPHNLYTSTDTLRRTAKKLQMNTTTLPPQRKLLAADAEIEGEPVENVHIMFPQKISMVRFAFDQKKGVFARYITDQDQPHLNAEGEQLLVANVLIQFADSRVIDGDGRLKIALTGEGDALIFRGGKVLKGRWQKTAGELTKFTDRNGKEVSLLEGPTWLVIVPKGVKVEY